ncbi:metallophosphoesterase [Rhodohalobacter sp. 614A]|uniref:metallophosphoesterase n=1 Tax=Rhodohalobacter sp. 614A TaxID=2908649 RepID=UPI001F1B3CAC|nr:metallophosphoesterase [Rhodohalobacter sp. 614A]
MPWSLRMVMYAAILIILFLSYLGFRYFISVKRANLKPRWFWRSLFVMLAIPFLVYPFSGLFEFWSTGYFSLEEYPYFMIYLFWYGLVFTGVMLNWLILHDILLPILSRLSKSDKSIVQKRFAKSFLVVMALTLVYTAGKMILDTHRITVEEITVDLPEISGEGESFTIVHISDLQADHFTDETKTDRYIGLINEANPDMVVFTGDLITSGLNHVQAGARALGKINSTYGVFAVLGDHDYWAGSDAIVDALRMEGVNILLNEDSTLVHENIPISVTGVTEIYSSQLDNQSLGTLINDYRGEGIKMVMSHQASDRLIEFSQHSGTDLLLGGHTHGGQIIIPIFFYPFTAVREETEFVSGHWQLDEMFLNVNNGLGFTLSPVRYNVPAQISVIRVE